MYLILFESIWTGLKGVVPTSISFKRGSWLPSPLKKLRYKESYSPEFSVYVRDFYIT